MAIQPSISLMNERLPQLEQYAEDINRILSEGRETLARREVDQWQALALSRFQMVRALNNYQRLKDEWFLKPVVEIKDACLSNWAESMRGRANDLQAFFGGFISRWALNSPMSTSEFYLADAHTMATLLKMTVEADMASIRRMVVYAEAAGQRRSGNMAFFSAKRAGEVSTRDQSEGRRKHQN